MTGVNGDLRGVVAIGASAVPSSLARIVDRSGPGTAIGEGHFRCRVGHAWTPDSLLAARDDEVEGAALAEETEGALRVLGERLSTSGPLASEFGGAGG